MGEEPNKKEATKENKMIEVKINLKNWNWNKIFKEVAYWLFFGILILFFNYLEFNTVEKQVTDAFLSIDAKRIKAFIVLFIFALIIDISLHISKSKKLEIYQKFIVIAVSLAICYQVAVPFGQGNDEVAHFLRIFEISRKYTTINYVDSPATSEFTKEFSDLLELQKNEETSYNTYKEKYKDLEVTTTEKFQMISEYWNMRLYSPIQYLPQVIGVTIGRVISDNLLVIGTLGRIAGFVAWLLLCAYSIKTVPNKKTFFMILCLLPINIFSAVCLSGDTLTNAVCMLFIAILYRKIYLKEKVELREKIILVILGCLIALCKIVYLPFVFLILLLKEENFDNKKAFIVFSIILIIISCIVGLFWFRTGKGNLSLTNLLAKDQANFIIKNPIRYGLIMLHTFEEKAPDYIYQFSTGYELLCHGKVEVYPIIGYLMSIVVILSIFIDDDEKENKNKIELIKKIFIWLIMLAVSVLIATAIYIQWTSLIEIGRYMIAGIQGRYFIPVVLLLIFIIDNTKILIKKENLISFLVILQIPILALILSEFTK